MNKETALIYNLDPQRLRQVGGVLAFLGIRVREVRPEEYGLTLEQVLAGAEPVPPQQELPGEMMVLCIPQSRVDAVVSRFRRHGVRLPALTAMLTPTNSGWTAPALAAELTREREAFARGQAEH